MPTLGIKSRDMMLICVNTAIAKPTNKGPKVKAAQYSSNLCPNGRRKRTRQMALSERSMVKVKAMADKINAITPTMPSRLALLANCVK